jgi:hypothetical protein
MCIFREVRFLTCKHFSIKSMCCKLPQLTVSRRLRYIHVVVLYARLRRSCSSLKYDLFRSNIITDSRCVCGFTREDASHFLLNCRFYIKQRTVLFNFLHHRNFRRDIRSLLFGDSQKNQAQNMMLSKAVQTFIKNSRRFTEGT